MIKQNKIFVSILFTIENKVCRNFPKKLMLSHHVNEDDDDILCISINYKVNIIPAFCLNYYLVLFTSLCNYFIKRPNHQSNQNQKVHKTSTKKTYNFLI